jgi:hypothetical protein
MMRAHPWRAMLARKKIAMPPDSVNADRLDRPETPKTVATSGATTPAVNRPPAAVFR